MMTIQTRRASKPGLARLSHSRPRRTVACASVLSFIACGLVFVPALAHGAEHKLQVRIIHASKRSDLVDPKLKDLARELKALPFTSYSLKDEARFSLAIGSSGRMQMPGKEWLTIKVNGVAPDGKLRIEIAIQKLQFKAGLAIAAGATVALRGPKHEGGVLILAVTRAKP